MKDHLLFYTSVVVFVALIVSKQQFGVTETYKNNASAKREPAVKQTGGVVASGTGSGSNLFEQPLTPDMLQKIENPDTIDLPTIHNQGYALIETFVVHNKDRLDEDAELLLLEADKLTKVMLYLISQKKLIPRVSDHILSLIADFMTFVNKHVDLKTMIAYEKARIRQCAKREPGTPCPMHRQLLDDVMSTFQKFLENVKSSEDTRKEIRELVQRAHDQRMVNERAVKHVKSLLRPKKLVQNLKYFKTEQSRIKKSCLYQNAKPYDRYAPVSSVSTKVSAISVVIMHLFGFWHENIALLDDLLQFFMVDMVDHIELSEIVCALCNDLVKGVGFTAADLNVLRRSVFETIFTKCAKLPKKQSIGWCMYANLPKEHQAMFRKYGDKMYQNMQAMMKNPDKYDYKKQQGYVRNVLTMNSNRAVNPETVVYANERAESNKKAYAGKPAHVTKGVGSHGYDDELVTISR
jgi:mRNA-degrading endonuclease YafQ of YafQ-DinJ toxin-antitoxin module